MTTFQSLGLQPELLETIDSLGFKNPTPVQEKVIPLLLKKETDLVALAQTGTGKTAAFGFPLLQKLDLQKRETQSLIIAPTRELCLQITSEMERYSTSLRGIGVVAIYFQSRLYKRLPTFFDVHIQVRPFFLPRGQNL